MAVYVELMQYPIGLVDAAHMLAVSVIIYTIAVLDHSIKIISALLAPFFQLAEMGKRQFIYSYRRRKPTGS